MIDHPKAYLYRRVVQAKLFIDAHFAEPLRVDDISGEAAFSKFHFIRLFKQVYGRTPHEQLTHVRMEHAKKLLAGGMPATDVCYAVGFTSMGSFSRLFKRCVGVAPSSYRAQDVARAEALREQHLVFIPGCFARSNGWA